MFQMSHIDGDHDMNIKRHQKIILPLLSILAMISLAACASDVKLPRLADDAVILAFGDSITFGTGVGPHQSYPAYLERMTRRRVVNAGMPGEGTAAGLSRLKDILGQEKPALIIICHGGNDYLRQLSHERVADNIREMVNLARKKDAAVVLIAVPTIGWSKEPAPLYREIAEDMTVPLEEKTLSAILADDSLKSDLIHPNAAGYHRMAESIVELLKKSGAID